MNSNNFLEFIEADEDGNIPESALINVDDTPIDIVDLTDKISLTDAITQLRELEAEVGDMHNAIMMIRWRQGIIASSVDVKYGENTIKELSQVAGVHENTLRECVRLVEFFNANENVYKEWLAEGKNGRRRFYEAQQLIRSNTDPRVLGPENLMQRVVGRLEKTAEDLELLSQYAHEGNDEAEGVLVAVVDTVREFGANQASVFQQPKTPRSEAYLNYIRSLPCAVSKSQINVEAHHVIISGKGIKGSDFSTVPLSHDLHMEYHATGRTTFENKYNVNMDELMLNYLHKYLTGQSLTVTL
jgi:hypothetical protein